MGWMGTDLHRDDELQLFVRIKDGASVVWRAAASCLFHATMDGLHAVCSSRVVVSDEDPYPGTVDRSHDLMTCKRCASLVKRCRPANAVAALPQTGVNVQGP
jgi:hypothetical protein